MSRAKQEREAVQQRVDGERTSLEADRDRLAKELQEAEAVLPAEFRVEYARVVKARGEDALAPLDGECCGGCYQTITPQMINELMQDRPVTCKSCGCLMYRPEGWESPTRGP